MKNWISFFALTLIALAAGWGSYVSQSKRADGPDAFTVVTGDDGADQKKRWNEFFQTKDYVFGREPTPFLKQQAAALKGAGKKALVIPMEEGRNAVYLAQLGFEVSGVDFSRVALIKSKNLARERKVSVIPVEADLNFYEIDRESYDLITALDFHLPRLISQIKNGLKPGGLVIYQSPTEDYKLDSPGAREFRRDMLLKRGELLQLFSDFEILSFREDQGPEYRATLVARKPTLAR